MLSCFGLDLLVRTFMMERERDFEKLTILFAMMYREGPLCSDYSCSCGNVAQHACCNMKHAVEEIKTTNPHKCSHVTKQSGKGDYGLLLLIINLSSHYENALSCIWKRVKIL